jgi:hypothetical protein
MMIANAMNVAVWVTCSPKVRLSSAIQVIAAP